MYMIEIDDSVHDVVTVSCDNVMHGAEDAIAEWMDRYGEDLNRHTDARLTVYAAGYRHVRVALLVQTGEEFGSDGERLLELAELHLSRLNLRLDLLDALRVDLATESAEPARLNAELDEAEKRT